MNRYFLQSMEDAEHFIDDGAQFEEVTKEIYQQYEGEEKEENHTIFQHGVNQTCFTKTVEDGF